MPSVELDRVSETLLWTLYHRAVEARRPDAVVVDPLAVELVRRIDFPFVERFGDGSRLSQWQALRARCFDGAVRAFLARHPGGTVVALGEGLETQFWRVDNGRVCWLTVDLPAVVALRDELLPPDPRRRGVAVSALDPSWSGEVDASAGVLLTAQGLFMYLEPDAVRGLVERPAARFAGSELVFDGVPRWLVERGRKRSAGRADRLTRRRRGAGRSTGWRSAAWRRCPTSSGCGGCICRAVVASHNGLVLPVASRTPLMQRLFPSVLAARFVGSAAAGPRHGGAS